jgi:DNA-binding transcriptional regulator YhcF (GntR family)
MKLYEIFYREVATDYLSGRNSFTQKELSNRLGISIGNINKALKALEAVNAVRITSRSFSIIAIDRLLLYWAAHRKLNKDIVYKAFSDMRVSEIEASMPNGTAFTAYTAYKKIYKSTPADYSEVYVYATESALNEIERRFTRKNGAYNIFVLKADPVLAGRIKNSVAVAPLPNAFVDLWNIRTWYAKEFTDALSKKLFGD